MALQFNQKLLTVGIVAGELSGDQLGAGLINALKVRYPQIRFVGVGGPAMIAAGCHSLFPLDRLSVMGLFAVLGRLRELLHMRRQLKATFCEQKIDLFIGIDSPDFNLGLALELKKHGIKTAHYVSPSVWAWRQGRIKKIRKAVDLMLTLLPFEADFYREHGVPVRFVGHPFASDIDMEIDSNRAKRYWGFRPEDKVVALMPGSRAGELKYMGPLFLQVADRIHHCDPSVRFIVALANEQRRQQFSAYRAEFDDRLPIQMVDGFAREVMAGADVVLATSGTVTLEAMLLKRPMVSAYRWSPLSHAIFSPLVNIDYIALPNLLAKQLVVPEFLQQQATVDNISVAVRELLDNRKKRNQIQQTFIEWHQRLNQNASSLAAEAVLELVVTQSSHELKSFSAGEVGQ